MFNDDKMVKNIFKDVSNYSRFDYQKKTSAIFNGLDKGKEWKLIS